MSNTIDERVVKMQFDNQQFEQNVQTSLSTLDKLKQALNFGSSSKSLENVNEAVKNNNLPILGSAVDSVSSRFSALEVAAVTAIANIANSVTNKLKSALDAVTIAPLRDGFKEYETQMDSVQTIMANTGKGVKDVNASLDVMNTYADKTIYNFQEMAANLGRFTAAGTELETSQQAIMGISNLAAVSGSNSQKASVAMYQLSQAIAAGSLKLQDWNSVVNAGMGGKVFQDALQRTAQHMLDANVQVKDAAGNMISYKEAIGGTTDSIKDLITDSGSFRESLHKGWITTDVLTETLRQFQLNVETTEDYEKAVKSLVDAGYTQEEATQIADMAKTAMDAATKVKTFSQLIDTTKEALGSGWTKTWQILFGDFEEAKAMWTEVSDVINDFIGKNADARNNLLSTWKKLGGRTALLEGLHNAFSGLLNVIHPVQEAFGDVFKPLVAFDLFTVTKNFRDFTASLHLSDEAAQKVYDVFHGLFSVIHGVGSVIGTLSKLVGPLIEVFKVFFEIFLDIVSELGSGLTAITGVATQSQVLGSAVEFVSNVLIIFAEVVKNAWSVVKDFYSIIKESFLTPGLTGVLNVVNKLGDSFVSVKNVAVGAIDSIRGEFNKSSLLENIKSAFKWITQLASTVGKALGDFFTQISQAFGPGTVSIFDKLFNILTAGGIALVLKNLLALKDAFSIKKTLDGFKGALETVKDTIKTFQTDVKSKALLQIAIAIGILAVSLLILSSIDPQKMNTGLEGLIAAISGLVGAMAAIDKIKTNPKNLIGNATGMILIAAAVSILAGAIKKLSDLSFEQIGKGLLGIGVLLKMVSQFLNGTYFDNKGAVKTAIGLLILSAAIRVLASSVAYLGELDLAVLGKGLISIGILLAELGAFTKLTSGSKGMFSTGLGLIFIAASMKIFASAMKDFGSMEWEEIKKGLAAMGGALLELSAALNLMPKGSFGKSAGLVMIGISMLIVASTFEKFGAMDWDQIKKSFVSMGGALLIMSYVLDNMPKGAVSKAFSLILVATSLILVANAFSQFGNMDWDQIKKALVAMGGALVEMAVAMSLMSGAIAGAAAVMIIAIALMALVPVFVALGNLKLDQILMTLIAIGGVFAVLAVGALALSPAIVVLLGAAAALIAISAGFALFGAALGLVAAGILALSRAVSAVPAAIDALVAILDGLVQKIVPLLGDLVATILQTLVSLLPTISMTIMLLLSNVLLILQGAVPMLAQALLSIITSLLQVVAANLPAILGELLNIIMAVLQFIRDAIPQIVTVVGEIVTAFINAVATQVPAIISAAFNLIISFIEGLATAIEQNKERLTSAVSNLINAIISTAISLLTGAFGAFFTNGGELIGSVAKGIGNNAPKVASKVGDAIGKGLSWIIKNIPKWLSAGGKLIANVASGIAKNAPKVASQVLSLMAKGLSSIKKNLPKWLSAGKELVGKLISGLLSLGGKLASTAGKLASNATSSIKKKVGEWRSIGRNMVSGLIGGIMSKAGEVASKAASLVSRAISAAKSKLDSHSPSRVFIKIGEDIDNGLMIGIDKKAGMAANRTGSLAERVIDAARGPMEHLADLFSGDIVTDPTITPVMDLSEIQNGTDQLYAMMNEADRFSFHGNVDLATETNRSVDADSRRKEESQASATNALIDAINGLTALIGNTGNVYNVNGVTYDDGSNVSTAVRSLIRAAKVEGRA